MENERGKGNRSPPSLLVLKDINMPNFTAPLDLGFRGVGVYGLGV